MSPTPSMIHHDVRLKSFLAITKPKSRAKIAFPLSSTSHPKLTPSDLASAGFFHDPGSDKDTLDTCKCFICGLKLGGWDSDDDPYEEHMKRGRCPWAEFVCAPIVNRAKGIKPVYLTEDTLPSSAESSTYREQTYMKAWPHKQKSGWLPTVKNMAKAGYVLNATTDSKDVVICPFCEHVVEEWEATDDPWAAHQRKSPTCMFFMAKVEGGTMEDAPSKKARRTTKAGGRRKGAAATESQSQSQPELLDDDSEVPPQSTSQPTKPVRQPRATTKGKGKKKDAEVVAEDEGDRATEIVSEVEPEEESTVDVNEKEAEVTPEPVKEKKTRSRAKGKNKAKEDEVAAEESQAEEKEISEPKGDDEDIEDKPESSQGKGKTRSTKERKKPAARTKTKARTKGKEAEPESGVEKDSEVQPSEVEQSEVEESQPVPEIEVAKPKSSSSKPSSRDPRGKRAAAEAESEKEPSEMEASEVEGSQSSAKTAKSKGKPKSKSSRQTIKPVPPVPTIISSAADQTPQQPTSQLDRFANIPPSPSPTSPRFVPHIDSTPRPKSTLLSSKPTRPSPHSNLSREVLDKSVTQGAVEARKVMEDLTVNSQVTKSQENGGKEEEGSSTLSEEEKKMTLEGFIRGEMKKRYNALESEGNDMIGKWETRTRQARKRIEGL